MQLKALGAVASLCYCMNLSHLRHKSTVVGVVTLVEVIDSTALIVPVFKNGLQELWEPAEPSMFHAA